MKYQLSVLLSLLAVLAAQPLAHADTKMSLDQVMQLAAHNPESQTAQARADGAEAAAKIERRMALFPTVSLAAGATLRDREFTLATPMGNLPVGDTFFMEARLRISQPLFDATRLFHTSEAAKHEATAARHLSKRKSEELASSAAQLYFDILAMDALRDANDSFIASLQSRLAEVQGMVRAERVIGADELRVALALQNAEQLALTLREEQKLAKRSLGRLVGDDDAVQPTGLGGEFLDVESDADVSQRGDLLALRAQTKAARKRLSGVRSELLPSVVLNGDAVFTEAGPQAENTFLQGSINLVWVPFAGGTRSARKDIHRAEIAALQSQYEHARRGATLQVEAGKTALVIAEGQLAVAAKAVAQSQEAARISRERYASGRELVGDVLDAEALLRDSLAKLGIATIDRRRAQLTLRISKGSL